MALYSDRNERYPERRSVSSGLGFTDGVDPELPLSEALVARVPVESVGLPDTVEAVDHVEDAVGM